jgi:hypothetical protein
MGQVQADELRVRFANATCVVWMAMAMVVTARLWLGGVVSTTRDWTLADRLVALAWQRLIAVDGFGACVEVFRRACATYHAYIHGGRTHLRPVAGVGHRAGGAARSLAGPMDVCHSGGS